jgi:hypothetical protein
MGNGPSSPAGAVSASSSGVMLVDTAEFSGMPQPLKDSYRKNIPLLSAAYWNKVSTEWNSLSPDKQAAALTQFDSATQQMIANIQKAPNAAVAASSSTHANAIASLPTTASNVNTSTTSAAMDKTSILRRQISDYIAQHSKTVPANFRKLNIQIKIIAQGCTIDVTKQIDLSGTPSGDLSVQDLNNLISTFNLPMTPSQYHDDIQGSVVNISNSTITIPMCDGTASNSQYLLPDALAYQIATKYPPTSAPSPSVGTSGYVSFGSPYLSIGTGQPMWAYTVAIFAIIIALILAKKSK